VEFADINNDGDIDLVSGFYIPGANPIYIWNGTGDGNWDPYASPTPALGYNDIAFGDVDHSGTLDLLAASHMNGFRFWLGDGEGGWNIQSQNGLPSTSSPPWIGGLGTEFCDVDHDGNLDIILGGYNGNYGMRVFTSDGGSGGEVDWTNNSLGLPMTGQYGGVALGDVDHDGNPDIVSSNNAQTSNGVVLYLGNGGEGGSMFWSDVRLPNIPSSGNFWGAALGDVNLDGILDIAITSDTEGVRVYITQTRPSYLMDLEKGWNLISLPLIQDDTNIEKVFESIDGDYSAVQFYETEDNVDPWKDLENTKPDGLNDLYEVNHTMGIWIYITKSEGTTLTVFGEEIITGQSIELEEGWNLVGFPSKTNKIRDTALNNMVFGTEVETIQSYDSTTKTWEVMGPSDSFEIGRGYWIYSNVKKTWIVPL
jgi:hypothetical protein